MSKTPFHDFLKKLSDDHDLSRRYFERMLAVFEGTGLSQAQVQALCSGSRKLIEEVLHQEVTASDEKVQKGPMPLSVTHWIGNDRGGH